MRALDDPNRRASVRTGTPARPALARPGSTRIAARRLAFVRAALVAIALGSAPVTADPLADLLGADGEPATESAAPAPEGGTIDAQSSAVDDADIRRRLLGIYDELEALDAVEPGVANGIVTLGGTADSARSAERAREIASQVEGVVEVVDEMAVDTNVARRLGATVERLRAGALAAVAALPILLLALGVVALFWWLGRWFSRREGLFAAIAPNGFIAELLGGIARIAVVLLGLFLALSLLDATSIIGTVLGAAGIVGLAVGFAVRDTVENWIASVLLSLRTPFVVRDYVQIGEHQGAVARLTSRATVLISLDGNHIRIPNATVFKSVIVNYSRSPDRRFEFTVGIDTELDLGEAQRTALEAVHEVPGVLDSPAATVIVEELGDSNVTLSVLAWMDQRTSDVRKVRSEAIRFVKQAFDAAGIVMPEPIYRVNLNASAASTAGSAATGSDPLGSGAEGPARARAGDAPGGERADGERRAEGVRDDADATNAATSPADGAGPSRDEGRVSPADTTSSPSRSSPAPSPPVRRLRAHDAADTSIDAGVEATLAREIDGASGDENLLGDGAPRE